MTEPLSDAELDRIEQAAHRVGVSAGIVSRLCDEVRRLRGEVDAYEKCKKLWDAGMESTCEDRDRLKQEVRRSKPLSWTSEPPSVPGEGSEWYWWRGKAGMPAIVIEVMPSGRTYSAGTEIAIPARERGGEWAGPLGPPPDSA